MKSRVVVAAVIRKGDYFLFGKKPEGKGPYEDKWLILGGGVNLGEENIREALIREIREEADIEIANIEEIRFDEDFTKDKHGEMTHFIFLTFSADYKSGEAKPQDDIAELKWVHKSKIKELMLCEPSLRLFRKMGYL